jgi:AraC-like DNA-binding protein
MSIPFSDFDTRKLPADIAWSLWHEQISVLFDSRPHKTMEDGFFASVQAWLLGDAAFGYLNAGGQHFDRSRKKIARDSMDGYLLQFYIQGQSEDRQGQHVANPGDLYVLDMAQPLATSTTECAQLSLVVPRRLLSPLLKAPDACHGRVIGADEPLVRLLRDTLVSFYRNINDMPAEVAQGVLRPVLDLAAMSINARLDEDKIDSVNLMLSSSIRRYVESHLLDADLSVVSVMAAFGLSRRTVYRLFESAGGFASYVQERRLRRAHEALRAQEYRHLSIAGVGEMHGFSNPENFTRAFRRLYDMTPREVRHLSATDFLQDQAAFPESAWSQWIVKMGR